MGTETITSQEVKHIAELARLGLTDSEVKQAANDLANVLEHFSQIQAIDTTNVPTSDDITGQTNITREDKVVNNALCSPQTLLDNAPDTYREQIKVKAVFG